MKRPRSIIWLAALAICGGGALTSTGCGDDSMPDLTEALDLATNNDLAKPKPDLTQSSVDAEPQPDEMAEDDMAADDMADDLGGDDLAEDMAENPEMSPMADAGSDDDGVLSDE